ncbi:MAG: 30S ribosome-binding factor RbfA [Eubacteriales bacterium]
MSKYRRTRINDEMTRVMAEALRTIKDPRVADALVTITKSEVSGDLKFAKIYFSIYGADAETIKNTKKGFYSAAGYLRSYVARELNLRQTPELSFEYDNAMEHGADILRLLKTIETDEKDEDEDEKEETEEEHDE